MALVLADLVQENTNTTGTGTLTLTGAVSGYQTFAAIGNANTTYYRIKSGTDSEIGIGTYTLSGTTLARTTVLYSTAGGTTPITVAAGATVSCVYPAEKMASQDSLYAPSTFAGTYSDGIVVDYATGNGRISVGTADTISFYSGGVANTLIGVIPAMGTASGGTIACEQSTVLNSTYTLTSQTAAQKLFNASTNGAVTLAVGTHFFECFYSLSAMSATSGSFGFALVAGTAVIGSQAWLSLAQKGTATLATATALQSTFSTAANTTIATAATNTVGYAYIRGTIKITTAGTIIPSVSLGVASAAVVGVNSYFRTYPISTTSAANITVGNWS